MAEAGLFEDFTYDAVGAERTEHFRYMLESMPILANFCSFSGPLVSVKIQFGEKAVEYGEVLEGECSETLERR